MTNTVAFQTGLGRNPTNRFSLLLDFSVPPLVDHQNLVSSPTPNASNHTVEGDRMAWVSAVSAAVTDITKDRRTNRTWIHRAFVYDVGAALVGLPLGFYASWKASGLISTYLGGVHSVLAAAAYVYVFFMALWGYRILFGYARWAFPTMELSDNRNVAKTHRVIFSTIILGLIVNAVWELLR